MNSTKYCLLSQFFKLQKLGVKNQYVYFQKLNYSSKVQSSEIDIPVPWGYIKCQLFGNPSLNKKPILALHGFLDNSNSYKPLAPYLTKDQYYMVAIDLPGHGFSSHIPKGIPYTSKLMIQAVRYTIRHFNWKRVTFLAHSYGCLATLMYAAAFHDEVESFVLLDPIISADWRKNLKHMPRIWSSSIDSFIDMEELLKNRQSIEDSVERSGRVLTREIALQKLLKANRHLDTKAAEILLDRAIIVKENKLEFSRDLRLKPVMKSADHYLDFYATADSFHDYIKCPALYMCATPPSFGERSFQTTLDFITHMKSSSKQNLEMIEVNGTHHFHMIEPEKAAKSINEFLKKQIN